MEKRNWQHGTRRPLAVQAFSLSMAVVTFTEFLQTEEAERLQKRLDVAEGDVLRLKEHHPFLTRLAQLWHLRRDHAGRFALAERMILTPKGAEQATGDLIAQYKATWAKRARRILVACCGIGGELMALRATCPHAEIIAVDTDPEVIEAAAWNVGLMGGKNVQFFCAPIEEVLPTLGTFDHCFIDPDRRTEGKRRIKLEDYQPAPATILPDLLKQCRQVHMKVSPIVEEPDADCITWIAEDKTLKECVLHWGSAEYPPAIQITAGQTHSYPPKKTGKCWSTERPTLVELSPALLRAGVVQEVATIIDGEQLHPAASLLELPAQSALPVEMLPFLTLYDILEELPYSKALKKRFAGQMLVVKKRFFPLEPEAIRKQLGIKEGGDLILFCTTRAPQARVAFLCRRRQD